MFFYQVVSHYFSADRIQISKYQYWLAKRRGFQALRRFFLDNLHNVNFVSGWDDLLSWEGEGWGSARPRPRPSTHLLPPLLHQHSQAHHLAHHCNAGQSLISQYIFTNFTRSYYFSVENFGSCYLFFNKHLPNLCGTVKKFEFLRIQLWYL